MPEAVCHARRRPLPALAEARHFPWWHVQPRGEQSRPIPLMAPAAPRHGTTDAAGAMSQPLARLPSVSGRTARDTFDLGRRKRPFDRRDGAADHPPVLQNVSRIDDVSRPATNADRPRLEVVPRERTAVEDRAADEVNERVPLVVAVEVRRVLPAMNTNHRRHCTCPDQIDRGRGTPHGVDPRPGGASVQALVLQRGPLLFPCLAFSRTPFSWGGACGVPRMGLGMARAGRRNGAPRRPRRAAHVVSASPALASPQRGRGGRERRGLTCGDRCVREQAERRTWRTSPPP